MLLNILFLRALSAMDQVRAKYHDLTPMKLLYTLAFCSMILSCQVFDPKEDQPCFIEINSYGFSTLPNQGTNSENITEFWCSINDNVNGAYDLPAQIPVLESASTKLRVQAGIKNNGVGSTRIRYPFYEPYDTTMVLTRGQTYSVTPTFRYYTNVVIDASRNFENGNFLAAYGTNQGTSEATNNSSYVFEGNRSGALLLDGSQSYFLFKDVNALSLDAGNTIFLEMNYSNNNSFMVGSYVTTGGIARKTPLITITPTTSSSTVPSWNKIYIDLGALALGNPNASSHHLYFEGVKSEASTPRVFLDNIKIVRWP